MAGDEAGPPDLQAAEGGEAEPSTFAKLGEGEVTGAEAGPPDFPCAGGAKAEPPGASAAEPTGGEAGPLAPGGGT